MKLKEEAIDHRNGDAELSGSSSGTETNSPIREPSSSTAAPGCTTTPKAALDSSPSSDSSCSPATCTARPLPATVGA